MVTGTAVSACGAVLAAVYAVAAMPEAILPQREPKPELSVYRKHTIAILRRYLRLSLEVGRLPSLIGREFFRSQTSYMRPHTFEDGVHFVIDVERCIAELNPFFQQLIAKVVLQEYSWDETAKILGVCRRTVANSVPESIDQLTDVFLAKKILSENGQKR